MNRRKIFWPWLHQQAQRRPVAAAAVFCAAQFLLVLCLHSSTNKSWFLAIFAFAYLAIGWGAKKFAGFPADYMAYAALTQPRVRLWFLQLSLAAVIGGEVWLYPQLSLDLALLASRGGDFLLLALCAWGLKKVWETGFWRLSAGLALTLISLAFYSQGWFYLTPALCGAGLLALCANVVVAQQQADLADMGVSPVAQLAFTAPRVAGFSLAGALAWAWSTQQWQADWLNAGLAVSAALALAAVGMVFEYTRRNDPKTFWVTALTPIGALVQATFFLGVGVPTLHWLGFALYALGTYQIARAEGAQPDWLKARNLKA